MVHYISQLANSLSKNNEVYVIAQRGIETEVFNDSTNLIQLHTGNIKKNFIINTLLINRAISFLHTIYKINPDIIHLQSCHPWMCLFLPFLKKYKLILTIHDVTPHIGTSSIDQNISQKIHIKYSDVLVVHGQNAKKNLEIEAENKKIYVVPHGDYSFFTKLDLCEYMEEPFTLLFFGRIEAYKGLKYLIQAVPIIVEKIPNLKVIVAGSGNLKDKDKLENCPWFEIHNYFIKNNDVGKFFQRASVVVLPYIECTQTGVVPIAYAFKKPVVVTDVGSIPEVVDDGITGYVVPPKDPKSLAEAIMKIFNNDNLRKKMGENSYKKMNEEFSWDVIAEKTIKIYNDVLETHCDIP